MLLTTVTRRYVLSALHELANPNFSETENREIFGPCFRLHGHDYRIEVTVAGPVSPDSGLIISRDRLDRIVSRHLLEPFSKSHLNHHFSNTCGEALALEFFRILKPLFTAPLRLHRITVQETFKNLFSVGE